MNNKLMNKIKFECYLNRTYMLNSIIENNFINKFVFYFWCNCLMFNYYIRKIFTDLNTSCYR